MPEETNKQIVYHIARNKDELEQSFSLVYKEYASRGYIPKYYKSKLKLSIFNALPDTATFVAKQGNKVVATVTLIPDSGLGIPMDKIFKKEVDGLRKKHRKVSEVSQLSIDAKLFPKGWFSMFNFNKLMFVFKLFKLVFDYASNVSKIDELCIAVNPKHQYLYKFLYFEPMGKLKYYGSVNKAPALAFHLTLDKKLREKGKSRKALYNLFFAKKSDLTVFKNKYTLSKSGLKYFFEEKSDIFKKATKKQLSYIHNCYK
ncbi:MAG: hypothetical protein ABH872_03215 [Candidatus Omnitrophota bacterium]